MSVEAPWHAHIYFSVTDRHEAAALRDRFADDLRVLFTGRMIAEPVGPHPIPQYEIHFLTSARDAVIALIEASGLRALVHPLTGNDLADHTTLGHWIGEPLDLDATMLDPPGVNQGVARFGKADF